MMAWAAMRDFLQELLEASTGSRLRRFGGVLVCLILATLLRWLLDPYLGDRRPHLTYGLVLMFTAWRYGVAPSILVLLLGSLAGTYFFSPARYSPQFLEFRYWAANAGALLTWITMIILFGAMGAARRHAALTARQALDKQRQLEQEMTQRRQAEEGLRRAHHELERRVRERTSALEQANEALKEADRRKDEFLAMLAHELRNPLASVRNGLHILRMPNADGTARARVVQMMDHGVQSLVRMVDDLLDASRITRGKIQLRKETVHLATAVCNAVEMVRPLMVAQLHALSVALPPESIYLEADPTRLEQVLCNLLNNAARYTEPGGRIDLTAEREGGVVAVRVRDTGIGIAAELLPRVFDLFTQADRSLARSEGGLGIGLTLVRKLVEMMGGTVTAQSDGLGRGSEFVVRLPMLPPAVRAANGHPKADAGLRGLALRVLVVEDVAEVADVLVLLLQFWGHDVRAVRDGAAALISARAYHPDVILLDLGLPGLDGYDVARQLRREPGLGKPLLVAVTGYGSDDDRRRSLEAGFDHHLVKPVHPDALRAALASAELLPREAPDRLVLQEPPAVIEPA
jgi:signal transduction histidine kinase/ActR/RegA family two-component response regulator